MSNNGESSDYDIDYFYAQCDKRSIKPTLDQEERFCDRVWKLVDNGDSDNVARQKAWKEVFRNK